MKLLQLYVPEVCPHCNQTMTYLLGIDRGSVAILRAIASAIGAKGINVMHPRKEMEGISVTSNQVGNLSRLRFHGLIAKVHGDGGPGNYCLTTKGAQFLRGLEIPRFAIVSKAQGHQIGYYQPEVYVCKMAEFTKDMPFWEGINYEIFEGRVVKDSQDKLSI